MPYEESEFLPISALQHLLYCDRQCALIHVERLWAENRFTAEGNVLHKKAHGGKTTNRPQERSLRAIPIHSSELGLFGIADIVAWKRGEAPVPVEYKRGRPKKNDCDRVQLCAQAICLEEMTGLRVPHGEIFYGETRRKVIVELSEQLRQRTIETSAQLHRLIQENQTPPAVLGRKCDRCSLRELCNPGLTKLGSARRSFERLLDQIVPRPDPPEAIPT